jgi:hypothetical protein
MPKDIEGTDDADQDAALLHHEQPMHLEAHHVPDDLARGRFRRHRENDRCHDVAHPCLIDTLHLNAGWERLAGRCGQVGPLVVVRDRRQVDARGRNVFLVFVAVIVLILL